MTAIADLAAFAGATAGLLLLTMAAGYCAVRHLLRLSASATLASSLPAGVLSFVVIGGGAAIAYRGPLGLAVPLACCLLAAAGAVTAAFDLRRRGVVAFLGANRLGLPVTIVGACALYAWQMRAVFGFGPLATVSWNNDVLAYAYSARHLAELGSGSAGWIIGYDAGAAARGDVIGAYGVVITSGAVLGDPMRSALPLMCVAVAAIAASAFCVVSVLLPRRSGVAALAGLITTAGFAATYDAYQYFLSEKIAISITMVSLAAIAAARGCIRIAVWQALVVAALVLAYPQAAPVQVAMALVVAAALPRPFGRGRARTLSGRVVAVLVGTAVGLAALGPYLLERIDRARYLLRVAAGWAMPTYSLVETIGLPAPVALSRTSGLVLQALIVVALGFGLLCVRRRDRSRLGVALALLLPFALFVRFAFAEPDSYRQWKAMASAAPFAVVAVTIIGFVLLQAVTQRFGGKVRGSQLQLLRAAAAVLLVVWLAFAMRGSYDANQSIRECLWPDCPIGSVVRAQMHRFDATAGDGPVAVNLGPYWPSMAAAYYLWGRPIAMRDPNYWATSDEPVRKTLTPAGWRGSE